MNTTPPATLTSSLLPNCACHVYPLQSAAIVPAKHSKAVIVLVLGGIYYCMLLRVLSHSARHTPVATSRTPCPRAAEPQADVISVHHERLLDLPRLIITLQLYILGTSEP